MKIQWLKFLKKWLISYQGRAIAVGEDLSLTIEDAFRVANIKINAK